MLDINEREKISFKKVSKRFVIVKNKDGYILEYLLPYFPDLNLIEHYWFKVKNDICKVSHLFNNLFDALFFILQCYNNLSKLIYYMI
ncbi:transposase domain protein [Orientia tsutsugamushi str. Gilliam]|uniref:IS630 family transposase n=1 Tax=Orientia tsutsugamushi str. Gilliam TaxID=1359184 RepID=A0A0F3MH04_ORITS|nr:transposase domain protein [Orientia tsutsugamushi str. Gilliam]SPR08196.1 IS630 family transposase [Orientia tsutsugamushi str. Gilliam]